MTKQTVLITGALTGIGRATAFAFARSGASIVISGRHQSEGEEMASELEELGIKALFVKTDVRFESEVKDLIKTTVEHFGRIDVAVNNAGVEGQLVPIQKQTLENYHHTFDANVVGTMLAIKYEISQMLEQGFGSIINLSSIAGHVGLANASLYVASKHAIEGITKSVALEVASSGINVNAVAPGPIATKMLDRFVGNDDAIKQGFISQIPAKRAGSPEEVAATILFLASNQAKYINGQVISIDGAYTAQ